MTKRSLLSGLDPTYGNGFALFDIAAFMPDSVFDLPRMLTPIGESAMMILADEANPHYIPRESQEELNRILGTRRFAELTAATGALTEYVTANLPQAEKDILRRNDISFQLDLAEVRYTDGRSVTGRPVHIDWEPREGMVLLITLLGEPTVVYHNGHETQRFAAGTAVLISAFGRWETFHHFDESTTDSAGTTEIRLHSGKRRVPSGFTSYLKTRGAQIDPDVLRAAPGVLPTVHRAGSGQRCVLVLNFNYKRNR